ncbi:methionyl-tRNA formyltransferase [Flavobacterium sp. NKUCC04_CG]|uniref:methionyl-tRNA formyltransferase n=1 Tax=Flavobacterium sp. NKUCC04_CG TaxID=2842121 RepID=UPI001C5B6DAA|nr:methionyl-tRNA formyltransferase [Flavobacterium sp. NKUCC04_CG]MBW3519417.1 methionyl-tRNA formyltransferase [Flavobacterium sp. NKUCC04_CG]
MKKLRIIFMGTPEFAVGILDTIYSNKHEIVGVITAPDRPAGRGQKLKLSAVKEYALSKGIPVLQPTNLKSESFLEELKALEANLQVVVAFRMLPAVVWQMPSLGTFNLHASLLPDYRGAAPINWAIINGETKSGVTTFFIDEKIDTGAIILKKELSISADETAGQLHDRLMHLGSEAVLETLDLIATNQVKLIEQPLEEIKTAYKLNKENCKIDWHQSALSIHNLVRGLSPYPAAWCFFVDGETEWNVKVLETQIETEEHSLPIGTIICTKKEMRIAVTKGYIKINKLQFPGKKPMLTADLLNGIQLSSEAQVK